MRSAWKTVSTYQVILKVHQTKDGKTDDRTLKFGYKKPGWIRTDILEGKNKGGIAVYDPAKAKIRAREAGIAVTLSPDAKITLGLRGERIYDASFTAMLKKADWYLANGGISYVCQDTVDGAPCSVIEFKTTVPDKNRGIARERWWLDSRTGFPRKTNGFDSGGSKVEYVIFRDLKLNPAFAEDHFSL